MNYKSTTARIAAELQYAKRPTLSSAMSKLSSAAQRRLSGMVETVFRRLVAVDPVINKTDVLQLFASMGVVFAMRDPKYTGSS